jgi:hypothetical protein
MANRLSSPTDFLNYYISKDISKSLEGIATDRDDKFLLPG